MAKFFYLFLLFGTFVLVSKVEFADGKACTKECDGRIDYAVCPRLGKTKKINKICTNCCAGFKGCNYFSADGTFICQGESDYVSSSSSTTEAVKKNNNDDNVGKACTLECDGRISYEICPRSQNKKINRICTNCCAGKKGCNYFSEDGTFICEGESEYNVGKACPRNCDPRIAYGICPVASDNAAKTKKISFEQICTNCCAGKKGCNYFSADGTFICEGESEYVSNMEIDVAVS